MDCGLREREKLRPLTKVESWLYFWKDALQPPLNFLAFPVPGGCGKVGWVQSGPRTLPQRSVAPHIYGCVRIGPGCSLAPVGSFLPRTVCFLQADGMDEEGHAHSAESLILT